MSFLFAAAIRVIPHISELDTEIPVAKWLGSKAAQLYSHTAPLLRRPKWGPCLSVLGYPDYV